MSLSRLIWLLIGKLAFNRITVTQQENLPAAGPTLFVATHRNGALDGAPYAVAVPHAVPMVSAQLHRLPLGRFVFRGIAVSRARDKARGITADNTTAMQQCAELLRQGGQLFVMPEGTSTLGHAHLPFHRGAARIARAAMDAGVMPLIVPLGVHYEASTQWQSRVEVLAGKPMRAHAETEAELHRMIADGLESVGANFADEAKQHLAENLAYACTLGTDASYALTLKSFERGIPQALAETAHELDLISAREHLRLHQGVPLMPIKALPLYALYWLFLLPVIVMFCAFNVPVLVAGYVAGRKLPDAPNVIAFWRMTIALPAGFIWAVLVSIFLFMLVHPTIALLYWAGSIGGVMSWYRFRKLSVALYNGLFHASAKPALLAAYQKLLNQRKHESIA